MPNTLPRFLIAAVMVFAAGLSGCGGPSGDPTFSEKLEASAQARDFTGPALWQVSDTDTIVFMLGTVHTLRPGTEWRTEVITDALGRSDAVYFEADIDSTGARGEINQAVTELGLITDGRTLADILPEAAETEVAETLSSFGLDMQSITNYRPWLASFELSDQHQRAQGFDRSLGVDKVLFAIAERRAIPIRFLESGAYQIRLIASIPEDEQIALLTQTAEQIQDDPDTLDALIADWVVGDDIALAEAFREDEVFGAGEMRTLMLRKRNENWTETITKLMETEAGTYFVAVGAAHLAGDDSVQTLLAAKGIHARRINPQDTQP